MIYDLNSTSKNIFYSKQFLGFPPMGIYQGAYMCIMYVQEAAEVEDGVR